MDYNEKLKFAYQFSVACTHMRTYYFTAGIVLCCECFIFCRDDGKACHTTLSGISRIYAPLVISIGQFPLTAIVIQSPARLAKVIVQILYAVLLCPQNVSQREGERGNTNMWLDVCLGRIWLLLRHWCRDHIVYRHVFEVTLLYKYTSIYSLDLQIMNEMTSPLRTDPTWGKRFETKICKYLS